MNIFVAGATGVLGRRVVAQLVQSGHQVSAIARSAEKAEVVRSLGATPVEVSLFDAEALRAAVAGHDTVVNVATHIPKTSAYLRSTAWAENDRIRTDGSRNLVDAALAAGATRFVQESLAFQYADGGDAWLDEDAPLPDPPLPVLASVGAAEAQVARFGAAGGAGVVLRFGLFHEVDSEQQRAAMALTRWGMAIAAVGPADNYFPIVHLDDAASAVVAALAAPAGTYNITDDEPLTWADYASVYDDVLGDPGRVRRPPAFVARQALKTAPQLAASQRVSNRRFKEATGWTPAFASAAAMLTDLVQTAREPRRVRSGLVAVLLAVLAFGGLVAGLQALLAPQFFYDSFPGFGRVWLSPDGPYNEHFIRDFGGLNLGLAALAIGAAVVMTVALVRLAAVAHLLFGVPHLLYHLTHLHLYETVDRVANIGALLIPVTVSAVVLIRSRRVARPERSDSVSRARTENQTQGRRHDGLRTPAPAVQQ